MGDEGAELANNPLLFPDHEARNRPFTWDSLGLQTDLELEAEFDSPFGFFK